MGAVLPPLARSRAPWCARGSSKVRDGGLLVRRLVGHVVVLAAEDRLPPSQAVGHGAVVPSAGLCQALDRGVHRSGLIRRLIEVLVEHKVTEHRTASAFTEVLAVGENDVLEVGE